MNSRASRFGLPAWGVELLALGMVGVALRVLGAQAPTFRAGVAVVQTFALLAPMSTDRTAIRAAISEIEPGGSTSLRDTLCAALTLLSTGGRRVLLLVFTDGFDSTSWLPDRTIVETARESEAVVYAMPFVHPHERLLEDVTEATGGRMVLADSDDRLRRVFLDVLREMRSRYVLTFIPTSAEPGWHTLLVRLKKADGRVTARQGYAVR